MSDAPKYIVIDMKSQDILSVNFLQTVDPIKIINFMEDKFSESESYFRVTDPDEYETIYEYHAYDNDDEDMEDNEHLVLAFIAKDQYARFYYFNRKNKKDDLYFAKLIKLDDPNYIFTTLIDLDKK